MKLSGPFPITNENSFFKIYKGAKIIFISKVNNLQVMVPLTMGNV